MNAFSKIQGRAPSVINSDSLFDVLFSESELTQKAKETFEDLRDTLAYGGDRLGIRLEHFEEDREQRPGHRRQADPVFSVLALEVATILPNVSETALAAGTLTGHQIWMCQTDNASGAEDAWYKRALDEYFATRPGGSLLTFPGVRENLGSWWLLRPHTDAQLECSTRAHGTLNKSIISKDSFSPSPSDVKGFEFRDRFDQFGSSVFKELSKVQSAEETASSAIIWVYIGPPKQEAGTDPEPHTLWGVSAFAVIRPARPAKTKSGDWLTNPDYKRKLERAVGQLYFYLTAAAYKTVEYGHRSLLEHKKKFETTVAQAVAHEFKNLTQDISSLGGILYPQFFGAIREIRKIADIPPATESKLGEALSSLRQLSNLSKLTSAVALASYWLTTPDARHKILFEPDAGCKVFEAVVHFALTLCKETRPEWRIDGPPAGEVLSLLGRVYGTSREEELVERLDVALLLFVVSEPVRNLRSNDDERPEVVIHTEVRGHTLHICQRTVEKGEPKDHHSRGAERINQMLQAGYNMAGQFARLNETVRVADSIPQGDGLYEVYRRTDIEVFGIPIKA